MRIGFVDIETDQLEATEIVLVELEVLDMDNGKEERYFPGRLYQPFLYRY